MPKNKLPVSRFERSGHGVAFQLCSDSCAEAHIDEVPTDLEKREGPYENAELRQHRMAVSMNCGNRAVANRMAFGLQPATINPLRNNIEAGRECASGDASTMSRLDESLLVSGVRHAWMPRYTR